MNRENLELKVRFALAKGRNLVYYRLIDDRPRGQYIHVMRKYRQELSELIKEIDSIRDYSHPCSLFKKVIAIIPPKIKSEECFEVILEMNKILNYEQ